MGIVLCSNAGIFGKRFLNDMLFMFWHGIRDSLDWMFCILSDAARMIKSEKMGRGEYGGDVGNSCGIDIQGSIMVSVCGQVSCW